MACLLAIHFLQVLVTTLYLYYFQGIKGYIVCFLTGAVAPFALFVYVAIATATEKGCQLGMRQWMITDCIIFPFLICDFGVTLVKVVRNLGTKKASTMLSTSMREGHEMINKVAVEMTVLKREGPG
jgi:hypothetical protein